MTDKTRLIDSFSTKYGYKVSFSRRGRDYILTAHNGAQYFEIVLGAGDAARLAGSLATAASTSDSRRRTRKKLTVLEGGTDAARSD